MQVGLFMHGVKALVEQAVVEAFASSVTAREMPGNGAQRKRRARESGSQSRGTTKKKKRSSAEVAAMTARLYETIDSQPGQTMGVLARAMDCEPKDLRVSIRKLMAGGRVKKAGERMHTTYFPMDTTGSVLTES